MRVVALTRDVDGTADGGDPFRVDAAGSVGVSQGDPAGPPRRRGDRVPFGPYMIAGALIAGVAATV